MINFFEYIKANSSFAKLACDELLFVEYKCPISETKVPIWSQANYLAYVLSGRKIWSFNEESHELKEGDSIFVAKGAHYIEQILDKEFCVLIFFFPDEFLEDVLEEAKYPRIKGSDNIPKFIPIEVNDLLKIFFQSMASLFSQSISPSKELLSLKFRELIIQLINYQKNPRLQSFFNSVTSSAERKFKQMIESNLQFDLGIEEYAKMANMSVSTFKRYFKEVYNSPPGQYILNRRLAMSTVLLKKSDKSIQQIAYETGFESAAHFTRMFNKKYKAPPSKFRVSD